MCKRKEFGGLGVINLRDLMQPRSLNGGGNYFTIRIIKELLSSRTCIDHVLIGGRTDAQMGHPHLLSEKE